MLIKLRIFSLVIKYHPQVRSEVNLRMDRSFEMENNTPLVSVLINCYNGERYLKEAIDSVICQTYQNWELLFWDNQSTDNSKEIFHSYRDPRLKYFLAKEHTELGEARNLLLTHSKGDFIAFLDCDDLYCKEKLEKQVSFMLDKGVRMSYSSVDIMDSNGRVFRSPRVRNSSGYIFDQLLKKYEINMQTVMLDRHLLKHSWLSFNSLLTYSPDYNLFMQIASHYPVGVIKEALAKYRVYRDSLSSKKLGVVAPEMKITLDTIFDNNPSLRRLHQNSASYAYKKLKYYDAIFDISEYRYQDALRNLRKIRLASIQFFALYLMVLIRLPRVSILRILRRV